MVVQKDNKDFSNLNQEDRIEIYALKKKGLSNRKIAKEIGVHHTTIGRELKRNSVNNGRGKTEYRPLEAERKRIKRRRKANLKHVKLLKKDNLRKKILNLLKDKEKDWGPDEILGRLKLEGWEVVSTSTLYRFIRQRTSWDRYLKYKEEGYKNKKWKRSRKGGIKGVKKIDKRPKVANKRNRIGDWEIDTVVSNRKGEGGLFTATDRKSKYEIIRKIPNLKADTIYESMKECFKGEKLKTMTSDNGTEFARLAQIQEHFGIEAYTAHPYCSQERGTNERHNGLIRWHVPKGADISQYSDKEISSLQRKLNHKPRKCLDYRTPYEVYHNKKIKYIT